ncbi:MAG: substrate-binding domain-containing protein [Kiritimatiellae bacterium]|nr:substrate-binding domain-containing protein [Kiritimatiellia bacterium]
MANNNRSIVVAADFSTASGRNFFAGVLRYARLKGHWRMRILQGAAEFSPSAIARLEKAGIDGIISTELGNQDIKQYLDDSTIPLVAITSPNNKLPTRTKNLTYVNVDEVRIGYDAAAFFDTLGNFMTYASVRHTDEPYGKLSHGRRKGFRAAVQASGRQLRTFEDTDASLERLASWLTSLPKPVAVFAGRDTCARKIADACTLAGINVPRQVSILGVNNDETCCLGCNPPLSSIQPGAEDEGYAAAAELERLLHGRRHDKAREVVCKTTNAIVERGSTAPVKPATALIRRAVAWISDNAQGAPSVQDVAAALGVSRRLLELRFREVLGDSVAKTILRMRLEALARSLRESDAKMSKACRACGFTNLAHARYAFKRHFSMTMGAWRDVARRQ